MKPENLNFLEASGPLQACNGTSLPLPQYLPHNAHSCIFPPILHPLSISPNQLPLSQTPVSVWYEIMMRVTALRKVMECGWCDKFHPPQFQFHTLSKYLWITLSRPIYCVFLHIFDRIHTMYCQPKYSEWSVFMDSIHNCVLPTDCTVTGQYCHLCSYTVLISENVE